MEQNYISEGMKLYNLQGRAINVKDIKWQGNSRDNGIITGLFEERSPTHLETDTKTTRFSTSSLGEHLFYEEKEIEWKNNIEILKRHPKYAKYSGKVKKVIEKEMEIVKQLKIFHEYLKQNYGFEGFIHTTDFSNFINIMDSGYIYSRFKAKEKGLLSIDSAHGEIISGTSHDVQNKVRFYYRPKTPTHYRNEGIIPNNPEHHMPIPVILVLGRNIYYDFNGIFTDGNAKSNYSVCTHELTGTQKFNFNRIFSKGAYDETFPDIRREITRQRNAELLIPNEVDLKYIDKIIFRSNADFKMAEILYGNDERFIVDRSKFFNESQYCRDYKIEVSEENINAIFALNKGDINYIRSFSHIIRLKYWGYIKEYDIFKETYDILLKDNNWYIKVSIQNVDFINLQKVEYLIDRHVSAIWRG